MRKRISISLSEYYQTPWWIARSRKFRGGKTCSRCGSGKDLHVHHKQYRFYREKDSDLEVLCSICHLQGVHKQLTEENMLDLNHQGPTARLSLLIDKALEARIETPRTYLGASRLGEECSRALQFEFFGTPKDKGFSGQTLRTFAFGNSIEELMADWLTLAGIILTGRQAGFSTANGLIQGHVDGVISGGPEDFGPFPRLWECKSASQKKWKEIEKHHLKKANPVYYVQVQVYMAYLDLQNPALFTVMNKDTSELYFEDVLFDPGAAQEASDRGARIIQACKAGEILPRISDDPNFFQCLWCSWSGRCHV